MFGKCPKCLIKLKDEELANLKKGDGALCFKCGRLYVSSPLWIHLKFYSIPFFVFIVPWLKIKFLTIISCALGFMVIALYHELQAYLPLIEEKDLKL
jgi:hypothetical protein